MSILGTRVIRTEDPRLLTAGGVYVDDLRTPELDGAARLTFVRSPVAHARITGIDTSEASKEPGVVAVLTVRDMDDLAPPPDSGDGGGGTRSSTPSHISASGISICRPPPAGLVGHQRSVYSARSARPESESSVKVDLTVNGNNIAADVEDRMLLVHFLRDVAGLTATNVGCDTTSCGACTVLLDGESVKSCTVLAAQVSGREVTTVEGLARDGEMHPVQRAFHEQHGLQCGFCTPGMVMAIVSLLKENPHPTEEQVRTGLEGNLCRCTGYHNIVRAALAAADAEVPA